jgi:hypothetical protein
MLKRNGESRENGASGTLNRGEMDAYNEAFEEIRQELEALERIKSAVKAISDDPVSLTMPGGGAEAGSLVHIQNSPIDRWQICSTLLNLRHSQIFLCERSVQGAKEFAVIERFRSDSAYAQANADAEILSAGTDPVLLVEEYAASAEHTLRGMASNLVAKAHKIVWARYASTSPARVVQAISEKCTQAVSLEETETNGERVRHIRPARAGIPQRS